MKVAVMLAQEPVVAEDFSAAKRLQIYDVPDEGGESTLVCDVARDCLDDEALALRIVEEDCEAANLQLSGSMYARKELRGTNGSVSGSIYVDGDMEFEQLTISGAAEVSGLMNAESLTIHLGGSCEIGEIGGSEIFVDVPPRHAGFLAKLLGGFAVPTLKCGTIEGERIRLENTTCDTVRGKNVVIGPGCEIGLVEYSDELTVDPDSRVQRKEKMNGQGE